MRCEPNDRSFGRAAILFCWTPGRKIRCEFPSSKMALNRIDCCLHSFSNPPFLFIFSFIYSFILLIVFSFLFSFNISCFLFGWYSCRLTSFPIVFFMSFVFGEEEIGSGVLSRFGKSRWSTEADIRTRMSHPCLLKCQQAKHQALFFTLTFQTWFCANVNPSFSNCFSARLCRRFLQNNESFKVVFSFWNNLKKTFISLSLSIYIYIYIERERERKKKRDLSLNNIDTDSQQNK